MTVQQELARMIEATGSSVLDDADALRAALDDFLPEDALTLGELNLIIDAVRLGAWRRVVDQMSAGADASTVIRHQAAQLARDRGTAEVDGARWALWILTLASGHLVAGPPVARPSSGSSRARDEPTREGTIDDVATVPNLVTTPLPQPVPLTVPAPRRRRGLLVGVPLAILVLVAGVALGLAVRAHDGTSGAEDPAANEPTVTADSNSGGPPASLDTPSDSPAAPRGVASFSATLDPTSQDDLSTLATFLAGHEQGLVSVDVDWSGSDSASLEVTDNSVTVTVPQENWERCPSTGLCAEELTLAPVAADGNPVSSGAFDDRAVHGVFFVEVEETSNGGVSEVALRPTDPSLVIKPPDSIPDGFRLDIKQGTVAPPSRDQTELLTQEVVCGHVLGGGYVDHLESNLDEEDSAGERELVLFGTKHDTSRYMGSVERTLSSCPVESGGGLTTYHAIVSDWSTGRRSVMWLEASKEYLGVALIVMIQEGNAVLAQLTYIFPLAPDAVVVGGDLSIGTVGAASLTGEGSDLVSEAVVSANRIATEMCIFTPPGC